MKYTIVKQINQLKKKKEEELSRHNEEMVKINDELRALYKEAKKDGVNVDSRSVGRQWRWQKRVIQCLENATEKMKTVEIAKQVVPAYNTLSEEDKIDSNAKISFALGQLNGKKIVIKERISGERGYYWWSVNKEYDFDAEKLPWGNKKYDNIIQKNRDS